MNGPNQPRRKNSTQAIDNPVASKTILNAAASQSTSLYQRCSSLRARLMRIPDFQPYMALSSSIQTDPVNQLWECFALGTPLCFLYNLLPPPATPMDVSFIPAGLDHEPMNVKEQEKVQKRAVALFIIAMGRLRDAGQWDHDLFKVTELLNNNKDTNGFVKVVDTVAHLLDRLPASVFVEDPDLSGHDSGFFDNSAPTPPDAIASANESKRRNVLRELLETERKYVQDLEVMQRYARSLMQQDVVDQDTIHLLFPNLDKLVDFQRKFLIGLEGTYEQPWRDQHWGLLFSQNEEDFRVYEPYCANYTQAAELMTKEEPNLMKLAHIMNPKSELPAFLIKPVQRICKYPLLLESLADRAPDEEYPHRAELLAGIASAKQIADKVNEAQRRTENEQVLKQLIARVEDWKGSDVREFGELILEGEITVTQAGVDREYVVFLFEEIILCCKEVTPPTPPSGASGKKNKDRTTMPAPPGAKKATPLAMKGRVFINNVTRINDIPDKRSIQVWWFTDNDTPEFCILKCRTDEQMKLWDATLRRIWSNYASKRASAATGAATGSVPAPTFPVPSIPLAPQTDSPDSYQVPLPGAAPVVTKSMPLGTPKRANPYGDISDASHQSAQAFYHPSTLAGGVHGGGINYNKAQLVSAGFEPDDVPSTNGAGSGTRDGPVNRTYVPPAPYEPPRSQQTRSTMVNAGLFKRTRTSGDNLPGQTGRDSGSGPSGRGIPRVAEDEPAPEYSPPSLDFRNVPSGDAKIIIGQPSPPQSDAPQFATSPSSDGGLQSPPLTARQSVRPRGPRVISTIPPPRAESVGVNGPRNGTADPRERDRGDRGRAESRTRDDPSRPRGHSRLRSTERARGASPARPPLPPPPTRVPNWPPPSAYNNSSPNRDPVPLPSNPPYGHGRTRSTSNPPPPAYSPPSGHARQASTSAYPPPPIPEMRVGRTMERGSDGRSQSRDASRNGGRRLQKSRERSRGPSRLAQGYTPADGPNGIDGERRESGSSNSTGLESLNSQTTITSNESFNGPTPMASAQWGSPPSNKAPPLGRAVSFVGPPIRVKLHVRDNMLMIAVPRTTTYLQLVDRVVRKIRTTTGRNLEAEDRDSWKIRYKDDEGDLVNLSRDEDLQLAFESGELALFVHMR